jgi:hypothetical protein
VFNWRAARIFGRRCTVGLRRGETVRSEIAAAVDLFAAVFS